MEATYLLLMTKAAMRMTTKTMLPATDTNSTVGLAPSPIMGDGTEEKKYITMYQPHTPKIKCLRTQIHCLISLFVTLRSHIYYSQDPLDSPVLVVNSKGPLKSPYPAAVRARTWKT